jgi:hypothetical protein
VQHPKRGEYTLADGANEIAAVINQAVQCSRTFEFIAVGTP